MRPYEQVIRVHVQQTIMNKLYDFSNMAACAGIRGMSPGEIRGYATANYGGDAIPARPWLDAATGTDVGGNELMAPYENALRRAIKGKISSSTPVELQTYEHRYGGVSKEVVPGRLFGKGGYKDQAQSVMRTIAKTMARNQTDFIADGIMEPNAPSTIARKGFDKPLYYTGKLFRSIEGWVE